MAKCNQLTPLSSLSFKGLTSEYNWMYSAASCRLKIILFLVRNQWNNLHRMTNHSSSCDYCTIWWYSTAVHSCDLSWYYTYWFVTRTLLCYVRVFAIANPSVVCNVCAPTKGVETVGNISSPFCSLAILWPPCKILRRSSLGNLSVGDIKHKGGSKIVRWWTYWSLYIIPL